MKTNLESLRKIIQQSNHMTAQQRAVIEKALKQAEEDLQLKDRELQIESSLEKVREIALSMKQPLDMLEICKTISAQLASLGLKEIRNVQTAIFHEEKGIYFNYEYYAKHDKTVFTETNYKDHPIATAFAEQMLKGAGEVYIHSLIKEELKDWINYQKGTNVFIDSFLETATSLNYYWFSLGPVALGMSTYVGLSENEIELFKRFIKVFELSYRRYLDIEQAEAQAREAQIQLALERVRARTMAMQHSDELSETVYVLFQQFKVLGENPDQATIGIINEEERVIEYRVTMYGNQLNKVFRFSLDEPHVTNKIYNAWKENKKSLVIDLSGNALTEFMTYRAGMGGAAVNPDEKRRIINVAFFSKGLLNVQSIASRSEESIHLLERFATVFDQTYTRFIDLQKAEAQAREAQIEASLERVRGKAMAMHNSGDLTEAAGTVFTELNKLGINPIRSGFVLLTKESRKAKLYPATSFDKSVTLSFTGEFEFIGHPVFEHQYESWQKKENYFPVMEGEVMKSYYQLLSQALSVPLENFPTAKKQFGSFLPFTGGFLFTWSAEPYSETEINVLERFKSILDLTIRRYTDLKNAEAQARESQIEAGLERVRSRTLAMHSSDELAETAAVLFRQLIQLGIEPNRLYIGIIKDENGTAEFWITDEDGSKVSSGFNANMNDNVTFRKMLTAWNEKKKSITIDMQGEELQEYFRHLTSLHVPFKGGLTQTHRVQSIAYFTAGFIGIASPDSQPEETSRLLERFAAVFNLTYTRFSDLQLAEAQAKKAQMEAAMERVRGRALAMQQPEELMDVAETLRKEMGSLGVAEIETGTIFIFDEATETVQFGFTARDFSAPEKPIVTDTISVDLNQTSAGRAFLSFFRSRENKMSVRMEGAQRAEWIQYIYSQSAKANNYFGENIRDRTYHLLKFSNGAVAAVTDGLTLSDESWELLSRASSVFSLAYSRFKDLSKARIDLQNLKEEKKRSESLLLNILPAEIANELKEFGKSYARKHDEVTVLFADIKGFSMIAETLSAQELVTQLDECFRAFDHIVDKHGLEKIKTVGDAYVCACGLPNPVADHAAKAVRAAIDMRNFIQGFSITRTIQDLPAFDFRIGVHTGPVVTGVVGAKKFTYDIWGDAVNMAARMEQHGEAGKINISESTYALVKDKFNCTSRGKILAKNKGEVEMYFVEG